MTVRELAEMLCDDVIARNDNRDSHTKSNEPSEFILSYWRPAISLRKGIAQLLADSGRRNVKDVVRKTRSTLISLAVVIHLSCQTML